MYAPVSRGQGPTQAIRKGRDLFDPTEGQLVELDARSRAHYHWSVCMDRDGITPLPPFPLHWRKLVSDPVWSGRLINVEEEWPWRTQAEAEELCHIPTLHIYKEGNKTRCLVAEVVKRYDRTFNLQSHNNSRWMSMYGDWM